LKIILRYWFGEIALNVTYDVETNTPVVEPVVPATGAALSPLAHALFALVRPRAVYVEAPLVGRVGSELP
jgi:hypothetical protein